MALLQAVVIGLLALIVTPGYLFYFDVTPKVVVLLAGAAIVLLGWGAVGVGFDGRRGPAYRLFSLLLALNVVSLSISTVLSAHPALSAFGTNWRRFGSVIQAAVLLFAWLIATCTAGRLYRVRVILRSITVAGGISAVYGIAQYFGWDPILPAAGYHIGEGIWTIVRPPGTLGYVSYFATWLLFVTFLSLALMAMESSTSWRRVAFGTATLSTAAMFLTGTRAAMLGLVAGLLVRWYAKEGRWRWRPPQRVVVAAVLLLVAAVGFYISPAGWKLRSRARWFAEDPWGGNRPTLWRDTLRMAVTRLPQGYGPEVFTAAFPRFESKALAEAYPDFLHESPHNIFLDALVSQGVPGVLILFGLCFVGLKTHPRIPREPGDRVEVAQALPPAFRYSSSAWIQAALTAGIVSQLFTVFTVPTALITYVAIALAVGLASDRVEPRRDWRYLVAASPLALTLLYLALRFTIADHALALAQRSVQSGHLQTAVLRYDEYRRWNLPGTTADLWYSRALLGLAQKTPDLGQRFQAIAQSGAAALRATELAEDPFNAWYNMAGLYASQNDSARTESSLRAAVAASPNWFKPHWTLAQLLRLEHRMDEAEREAALAAELNAGKNPEVAQTLLAIRAQRVVPAPSEHE